MYNNSTMLHQAMLLFVPFSQTVKVNFNFFYRSAGSMFLGRIRGRVVHTCQLSCILRISKHVCILSFVTLYTRNVKLFRISKNSYELLAVLINNYPSIAYGLYCHLHLNYFNKFLHSQKFISQNFINFIILKSLSKQCREFLTKSFLGKVSSNKSILFISLFLLSYSSTNEKLLFL